MKNEQKRIIETGRELLNRNLVAGTWGNISSRLKETHEKFAITPSGMDYTEIEPEDVAILDLENKKVAGREKPSSESALHAAIYKHRTDVNAILHTHSPYATAVACARKDIPPIVEDMVQILGGRIETARYELPGTEELAQSALETLKEKNAVLLANHGGVALGPDLDEALKAAEILEKSAKTFILSKILGSPQNLSEEDVDKMKEMYNEYRR
ncbi:MAG: class II aldolase/adducin family protein [Candidatus Hadarchaeia archaeon]